MNLRILTLAIFLTMIFTVPIISMSVFGANSGDNEVLGDPIDNPVPLGDPIDNPVPLGDPIDNPVPL